MSRPQLIEWLESETGQQLERPAAAAPKSRHVSIRVPEELFRRLEVVAAARDETVSQTARRMLLDGLSTPSSTEEAIDTAIASLLAARAHLDRTSVDHDTALRAVTAAKDELWGNA
jgi:predicted transcriptional regulator